MCRFFAGGTPAPQGSKRLVRLKNGRTVMLEQSRRVKPWREVIAAAAVEAGLPLLDGDVEVTIRALWVRPASHFTKGGNLRSTAPLRPRYADADKVARAVLDAMAGIAYRNDRQVAALAVKREWAEAGERAGAWITVRPAGWEAFLENFGKSL